MKKQLLFTFLILGIGSVSMLNAQEIRREQRVMHLKLTEDKNGEKRVIDTVLTNASQAEIDAVLNKYHIEGENAEKYRVNMKVDMEDAEIENIDEHAKKNGTTIIYKESDLREGDKIPEDVRIILDSMGMLKEGQPGKMVIVDMNNEKTTDGDKEVKEKKIIMVKKVMIGNLAKNDPIENKKGNKKVATANQLKVDRLSLHPNPNNGLWKIVFDLPGKGNTQISIINKDGKSVYEERLKDFSGPYEKEIDMSGEDKGVYYLKVQQGDDILYKKIVIE